MKNELGIKICCENCMVCIGHTFLDCEYCLKRDYALFNTSLEAMENRIRELQEQLETSENVYLKTLDAYHDVAEKLEELKSRSRK